jgi:hypothetical protein
LGIIIIIMDETNAVSIGKEGRPNQRRSNVLLETEAKDAIDGRRQGGKERREARARQGIESNRGPETCAGHFCNVLACELWNNRLVTAAAMAKRLRGLEQDKLERRITESANRLMVQSERQAERLRGHTQLDLDNGMVNDLVIAQGQINVRPCNAHAQE